MKRGWGQNVRLTPEDAKRAILEYVARLAEREGHRVPDSIVIMQQADMVLLDHNNQRVDFARLVVTWDD